MRACCQILLLYFEILSFIIHLPALECRLIKIMEAQTGRNDFFSGSQGDGGQAEAINASDEAMKPHMQMYATILKICAATHEKADIPRAMSIAFQIHDDMISRNIKPSPSSFHSMYSCVIKFLDQHPEEEREELLRRVFESAGKHGVSRGELTGRHRGSLRRSQVTGKALH